MDVDPLSVNPIGKGETDGAAFQTAPLSDFDREGDAVEHGTQNVADGWDFAHAVKHSFSMEMLGDKAEIPGESGLELDVAAEMGLPSGKEFGLSLYANWNGKRFNMSVEVAKEPEDLHIGFKTKICLTSESSGDILRFKAVSKPFQRIVRKGEDGRAPINRFYELDTSEQISKAAEEMCPFIPNDEKLHINGFIEKHVRTGAVQVDVEIEFLGIVLPGKNAADWNFTNMDCKSAPATGLMRLYYSPKTRDFILIASDGKEMHAHRALLEAQSPVFAAMFAHDMKESREGRCTIPDVNSRTLQAIVKYGNGFPVSKIGEIDEDLMVAAEKYDLARLRDICEMVLDRNLRLHDDATELTFFYEF